MLETMHTGQNAFGAYLFIFSSSCWIFRSCSIFLGFGCFATAAGALSSLSNQLENSDFSWKSLSS